MENPIIFSTDYPLNILIAEADHDSRLSAKDMLIQLGYRPEIAATGEELLHKTQTNSFDVVLMDVGMPEAEGVLASLPGDAGDAGARRPIFIAMTVSGQTDFREMYLCDGMDHSITTPVDLAELSLQLMACSVLTGNRRIRPHGPV